MSEKSKGTALILSSLPVIGWFGFDKLYVGAIGLFIAQFVCSLLVVGLVFSLPYSILSCIILLSAILLGFPTFLYPDVMWRVTTNTDRIIGWIVILIYLYIIITCSVFYFTKD